MILRHLTLLGLLLAANPFQATGQPSKDEQSVAPYYPDAIWQHKTPLEAGINPQLLQEAATSSSMSCETKPPRDLAWEHYETFSREPFGELIGPIKDRGDPTGLI